jgi:hypothetical protein
MYGLVEAVGPDLTLAVFALALPMGIAALGFALLHRGLAPTTIMFATVLPAFVALPYASVRPQVLSWGLVAGLVGLLLVLEPARRHWLWAVVPLFALWANVHGLYAVGLVVLGWYALWTAFGRTPLRTSRWLVGGALLGAVLASAATPSGVEGLVYPIRFLNAGDWGLTNIPEWSSPNFHDAVQIPLLVLIVVLAVLGRGSTPGWLAGLAYIGVAMALLANRNAPVAAMFAIPTLAFSLARWRRSPRRQSDGSAAARRAMEVAATAVVVLAAILVAAPRATGIQLERFPRAGADILAVRRPDARVLAEYGWGGYVAYRLYDTGGRVFVDGRNDLYPEVVLNDYLSIRNAEPGWQFLLEAYGVEAILLQPDAHLVRGLPEMDAWCVAHQDHLQVLLLPCATAPR